MKNSIALAVAIVAIAIVAAPEANAQTFNQGFLFGSGINAAGGSRCCGGGVRPPYFAEFPPVHYSGIVRRPYGISPYAAPAGVEPVEMRYQSQAVEPTVISNPHFSKMGSRPVSVMDQEQDSQVEADLENKSVRTANSFFNYNPESPESVLQASFER